MVELRDARAARHVGRDRAGWAAAQDVVDERGHVPARADLDEDASAVVVERLDRLAEAHRIGPVLDQQVADARRVLGIGRGRRTRPEPAARGAYWQLREDRAQVLGEGGEQRRVYGAVVGQLLAHQAIARGDLARTLRRLGLAHEHGLVRAVVHREVQLAARLAGDLAHAGAVGPDREQDGARNLVARRRVGI